MSVKELKEFTLKVERINCCSECPKQAEKKLKKLEGVDSVSIDANKGLVTVSGIIEPAAIINKFQVWGRKAVLHHDDDDDRDDDHNDHGDSNPCSVTKKKATFVELADRPSCKDDCGVNDWLKSTLLPTSHENALQQQQPPVQIGKPSGKKKIGFGGMVCKVFKLIKPKGKSEPVIGAKPKFAEGAGKWQFPKTPGYEFGPSRPFFGTQFPGTSMFGVPSFRPFTPLYASNGGAMRPGGLMTPPPPPLHLLPHSCYGPMRPPMLPPYGGASGCIPSSQQPREIHQHRPMVHYTRYEDDYLPTWT